MLNSFLVKRIQGLNLNKTIIFKKNFNLMFLYRYNKNFCTTEQPKNIPNQKLNEESNKENLNKQNKNKVNKNTHNTETNNNKNQQTEKTLENKIHTPLTFNEKIQKIREYLDNKSGENAEKYMLLMNRIL